MSGVPSRRPSVLLRAHRRPVIAVVRGVTLGVAAALVASLTSQAPAFAGPPKPPVLAHPLTPQLERDLPATAVKATSRPKPANRRTKPPKAPTWPKAASVEVDLSTLAAPAAGSTPALAAGSLPVRVGRASTSATARLIADTTPGKVRVDVVDHTTARKAAAETMVRVSRADGGADRADLAVSVDTTTFAQAYGGDYGRRLHLVQLPACALITPQRAECRGTPLATSHTGQVLTADVTVAAAPQRAALAGSAALAPALAAPSTLLAVEESPSGDSGTFGATSLAPSGQWTAGSASGDFSWRYGMRVPPAVAGPAPTMALTYSAQSVDGRTAASNNQPSWIGEGFDLWPGFIERQYKACVDDMDANANNKERVGDLCWGRDNAVMSYAGGTGELIRDDANPNLWRPKQDDGSRVEHLTGAANGADHGEYWKITTTDGTQYFFGLNHLPGWADGREETRSTWTVPVFGNHAGEPCHAIAFADSWCQQAYRWNLDYVVDPHGNSMSYWYATESNKYARNVTDAKATSYIRGGTLTRIDYSTRTDAEFGTVPTRVVLASADRCDTDCASHGANWPDVPWDQSCDGTSCKGLYSPTFWSTKRLSTVTTQVWDTTAGDHRDVESWTLHHTYPDPQDSTHGGLWLSSISHTGLSGGSTSLPDVVLDGTAMANRVDGIDHSAAMKWQRITDIYTETGAQIHVTYSDPQCVAGSNMPPAADSNTMRCYPVYWMPEGYPDPVLDWFHKYVVTTVTEYDLTGGGGRSITRYDYPGTPAWHRDEDTGLIPTKRLTWGEWRGYDRVVTTKGDPGQQMHSEARFFRGMDGDILANGGTRSASVTSSDGVSVPDTEAFSGADREQIIYDGTTDTIVSSVINDQWQSAATASRTINGHTVTARYVAVGATHTRIALDAGRGWRRTDTSTDHDDAGRPVRVADAGDAAVTGDERCTTTTYAQNPDTWVTRSIHTVALAQPCGQDPTVAADVLADARTSYDGQDYGAAPTAGDATRVEAAAGWSPSTGTTYRTTVRASYDAYGRPVESFDLLGNRTATSYEPATGGPLTAVVNTNQRSWTTRHEYDPGYGLETASVDANGKRTDVTYDPLGRRTAVWLPGRTMGTDGANVRYDYTMRTDGANAVTTWRLLPTGVDQYTPTYQLYDGLVRPRQTQAPAPGGGRAITDTIYDSAGRTWKTNNGWYDDAEAGTTLVSTDDNQVASQTVTSYDGVGRVIASTLRSGAADQWHTTAYYAGDRVDTTPPAGGTATSKLLDAAGRTVELRQYHEVSLTGAYDATRYTYDRAGRVAAVTDPAGNTWTSTFDFLGRAVESTDPDRGRSTFTYDEADRLATSTDARGATLAYHYDDLGRVDTMYDGAIGGPVRATWSYDTLAKGQVTASTRYATDATGTTAAYTTTVLGYTDTYQPTGSKVTIPAGEGKLAATYTFSAAYLPDGSPGTLRLPAAGDLAKESLVFGYTSDLGLPNDLSSLASNYVSSVQYTRFREVAVTSLSPNYPSGGQVVGPAVQIGTTYYEATRRVQRVLTTGSLLPAPVADVHYSYDDTGNITKITDAPQGGESDTQCFGQDYLGRLTEAWTPDSGDCGAAPTTTSLGGPAPYWQSWTYDVEGNRTGQVDHVTAAGQATTSYQVPAAGGPQPHTLTSTTRTDDTGTVTGEYRYDQAGNTVTRPGTAPSGAQTLDWDAEGHLSAVTEGDTTTSYVYDAEGNRLLSRTPTTTTLYLAGTELRLNRATGQVTGTRFYTFNGQVVAVRTAAGLSWVVGDHQGTESAVIDAKTQKVTKRRQTPFGGDRGTTPADWPTRKGFVGGDRDDTGLTQVGARAYDPALGRFLSVDPILDIGDPQQMHGYAYANNSPISNSDPTGLISWRPLAQMALWMATYSGCMFLLGAESGGLLSPVCGGIAGVTVYWKFTKHHTVKGAVKAAIESAGITLLLEAYTPWVAVQLGKLVDILAKYAGKAAAKIVQGIKDAIESEKAKSGKSKPTEEPAPADPAGDGGPTPPKESNPAPEPEPKPGDEVPGDGSVKGEDSGNPTEAGNDGTFDPGTLTEPELKKSLMAFGKQRMAQLRQGMLDDEGPGAFSVGWDPGTKKLYTGVSGSDTGLHPEVAAVFPKVSQLPSGRPPGVCAEARMLSQALFDGANLKDLVIVTVNKKGARFKMCPNCSVWVPGMVAKVLTG